MNRVKFTRAKEADGKGHWFALNTWGATKHVLKKLITTTPFPCFFHLAASDWKSNIQIQSTKDQRKPPGLFRNHLSPKNATVATQYRKGGDGTESVRTRRVQKMSCPVESWLGGGIGFEPGSYGIYFFCGPCGIIMIWRKLKMDHFV